MGGANRKATIADEQSWLYQKMREKNINSVDIQQLLGYSRTMLYKVLRNPGQYITAKQMMLLAIRLDEPLSAVFSWCVGGAAHYRKTGKTWFDTSTEKKDQ